MHFSKRVLIVEQDIAVFVSRRWIEVRKLGCLVLVHSDWKVIRESTPGTNSSEAYVVEYAQQPFFLGGPYSGRSSTPVPGSQKSLECSGGSSTPASISLFKPYCILESPPNDNPPPEMLKTTPIGYLDCPPEKMHGFSVPLSVSSLGGWKSSRRVLLIKPGLFPV